MSVLHREHFKQARSGRRVDATIRPAMIDKNKGFTGSTLIPLTAEMAALLEEQKSYYEARAAEYDEWRERRGMKAAFGVFVRRLLRAMQKDFEIEARRTSL